MSRKIPNINCKHYDNGFCNELPKFLFLFRKECIKIWSNKHCGIQNEIAKPINYKMRKWQLKDANGNYIHVPLPPVPPKNRIIKEDII